jgi:hypothetical protein
MASLLKQLAAEVAEGLLAQLVEQRTLNPLVEGSNPSGPTKIRKKNQRLARECRPFFFVESASKDALIVNLAKADVATVGSRIGGQQ